MRKHTLQLAALVCLAGAMLGACGSSSSSSSSSPSPSTTSILLQSDSGTPRAANGTWVNCITTGGSANTREEHIFSGATETINEFTGTTGPTCSGGTLNASQGGVVTISAQTTFVVHGWVDAAGATASPPAKASGVGTLGVTPTASLYTLTGTFGGVPVTGSDVVFVDDSAAVYRLYRSKSGSGTCLPIGSQDTCLLVVDFMSK